MSDHEYNWISTQEAADIIGITRNGVTKAARRGKMVSMYNESGAIVVTRESVMAYAASNRKGAATKEQAVASQIVDVTNQAPDCIMPTADAGWLLRAVSLMTPDEARMMAKKVLEATVIDPAARLLIERYI